MNALKGEEIYTIDDIYALPDGERAAGVREYWVVDPDKEMITVYNFEIDNMEEYSFGEDIPVGIYEDFAIKL